MQLSHFSEQHSRHEAQVTQRQKHSLQLSHFSVQHSRHEAQVIQRQQDVLQSSHFSQQLSRQGAHVMHRKHARHGAHASPSTLQMLQRQLRSPMSDAQRAEIERRAIAQITCRCVGSGKLLGGFLKMI